jgi:hypothetical protein
VSHVVDPGIVTKPTFGRGDRLLEGLEGLNLRQIDGRTAPGDRQRALVRALAQAVS